jgi:hypothetical protein
MSGKAYTVIRPPLLTCQHQKTSCTIERRRPSSAQISPAKGVDAKRVCRQTAIVRMGHQPGIGDQFGKSAAAGSRSRTVYPGPCSRRKNGQFASSRHRRETQRALPAISCQTLAWPDSASFVTVECLSDECGRYQRPSLKTAHIEHDGEKVWLVSSCDCPFCCQSGLTGFVSGA